MSATTPQQEQPRPPRPMWMLALFAIAVVVGLFNIGLFLYGLTLPSDWSIRESVEIDAPPEAVAPYLASPRRWLEWSSWSTPRDPTAEFIFDGPEAGKDASLTWRGEQLGLGKLTITESSPDGIRYRLELQGETFSEQGQILLDPVEDGTRIVWSDNGDVGGTIGRLFRQRLEDSIAADFEAALHHLKQAVESEEPAAPTRDDAIQEDRDTR